MATAAVSLLLTLKSEFVLIDITEPSAVPPYYQYIEVWPREGCRED